MSSVNWVSGSNVIVAGPLLFTGGLISITLPQPWEAVGSAAFTSYIGDIPSPSTFHLVLSNPAVSTIHSPQFWNVFPVEESVPVGAFPTSIFSSLYSWLDSKYRGYPFKKGFKNLS